MVMKTEQEIRDTIVRLNAIADEELSGIGFREIKAIKIKVDVLRWVLGINNSREAVGKIRMPTRESCRAEEIILNYIKKVGSATHKMVQTEFLREGLSPTSAPFYVRNLVAYGKLEPLGPSSGKRNSPKWFKVAEETNKEMLI